MRYLHAFVRRGLVVPAAACLLLSGCAMRFNARSLGVPVTMAAPAGQGLPGDTFNVTLHAVHFFWGLAPGSQPDLQHVLAGQLGTGGSISNLDIRVRRRWSDLLVSAITLGFISSTSVTYSGIVARGTP